jgi:hypothetical protein
MGLLISHMKIELALVVSNTFIPNHLFIMNKKRELASCKCIHCIPAYLNPMRAIVSHAKS